MTSEKSLNNEPKDLELISDIVTDSYCENFNNTFCVYKSINNILILIYSNKNKSFICLNLENGEKICEIKNNSFITGYSHFTDIVNKRDLLLTISASSNDVKLWNMNNIECLFHLQHIYNEGDLHSICFLNDNNNILIVCCNCDPERNLGAITIFDFQGNKVKEITDCNEPTYFIDSFYDNKKLKSYIISTHIKYVKSYDYENNHLYFKYDNGDLSHFSFDIYRSDNEDIIKIIVSCWNGIIRIWNFHTGEL